MIEKNRILDAINYHQNLVRDNPHNYQLQHELALLYAKNGDFAQAYSLFEKLITVIPSAELLTHLATLYKKDQQLELAISYCKQALTLNPDYPEANFQLALLYSAFDSNKALRHYHQALHTRPDWAIVHQSLGLFFLEKQQFSAAKTQFENVIRLSNTTNGYFYLGLIALAQKQFSHAEDAFKRVLDENPNHVEALCNLGVVALQGKRDQRAVDYFTQALAINNDHIEARNNLAACFIHNDRFENALMHYDVLLQKEPSNCEYLYNYATAQMALGHLNDAIEKFERVLVVEPEHFAALNNLAAIYMRMEERGRATELLAKAVAVNPQDTTCSHMLRALSGEQHSAATCNDYAQNLFNNYALYYDQHVTNYLHYALPNQVIKTIDSLTVNHFDKAVELGCGTGLSGQAIRDYCGDLHGVDIAHKMIERAREKGIYNRLTEQDALTFLQQSPHRFNLILAVDVLPYFGALEALFQAVERTLEIEGFFIFSTEISEQYPWHLQESVRFSHHQDYLRELASASSLNLVRMQPVTARRQNNRRLMENLCVVQKIAELCSAM